MTAIVLELRDITKSFGGNIAVDQVSFTIAKGDIVALIGPNGAGKSTCLNVISGLVKADSGQLFLIDRHLPRPTPGRLWRKGMGRTFQTPATFLSMTVRENIQIALASWHTRIFAPFTKLYNLYRDKSDELLTIAGLIDHANRLCASLSQADFKKLELALALVNDPKVLLMDEPTAGVSPGDRKDLMDHLLSVVQKDDKTLLFIEHDMDLVFDYAQKILVMDRGRLIAQGSPQEIMKNQLVQNIYLGNRG